MNSLGCGLRVHILTGKFHSPNGGISAHVDEVTIVAVNGEPLPAHMRVFPPTDAAPPVILYDRPDNSWVAYPVGEDMRKWHMSSGAYINTTDSRFSELVGHYLPIPLHDRTESRR